MRKNSVFGDFSRSVFAIVLKLRCHFEIVFFFGKILASAKLVAICTFYEITYVSLLFMKFQRSSRTPADVRLWLNITKIQSLTA